MGIIICKQRKSEEKRARKKNCSQIKFGETSYRKEGKKAEAGER